MTESAWESYRSRRRDPEWVTRIEEAQKRIEAKLDRVLGVTDGPPA